MSQSLPFLKSRPGDEEAPLLLSTGVSSICPRLIGRAFGLVLILMGLCQAGQTQTFDWCTSCSGSTGPCAYPPVAINPPLSPPCQEIELLFILDESGSINGFEDDVEDGVMAFLNALIGTGVSVGVIEFGPLADIVAGYTVVDAAFVSNMQGYFDGVPFNGETYDPDSGTNWMDAMTEALELADPDMILFFTDGCPTGWTDDGEVNYCGNGATTQRP